MKRNTRVGLTLMAVMAMVAMLVPADVLAVPWLIGEGIPDDEAIDIQRWLASLIEALQALFS